MRSDNEKREKLIESAKTEFLEKGYAKASLRKICANAGVTTGALYFFFEDKEDIFGAIVEKPLAELLGIVNAHFSQDESYLDEHESYSHVHGGHDEFAQILIHHLYTNYDAFILLLTKSEGTCYHGAADRVVSLVELHSRRVISKLTDSMEGMKVNDYIVHWLTHIMIDSFIHLLIHEKNEKMAVSRMRRIMDYIIKGYAEIAIIPINEE